MPTTPPSYTSAPPAPDPGNPGTFDALAYAWTNWQKNNEGPEMAAMAANVFANTTEAAGSAVTAAAQAAVASAASASAAAAAGAPVWAAGTYAAGAPAWSPIDGRTYRRRTAGTSATDPSTDSANWSAWSLVLPTVLISVNTTAVPGCHYVMTTAVTLTLPTTWLKDDVLEVTNASGLSGAAGPLIDFGTTKVRGRAIGLRVMDSIDSKVRVQHTGNSTYGLV